MSEGSQCTPKMLVNAETIRDFLKCMARPSAPIGGRAKDKMSPLMSLRSEAVAQTVQRKVQLCWGTLPGLPGQC